jgi:hypothetical protein
MGFHERIVVLLEGYVLELKFMEVPTYIPTCMYVVLIMFRLVTAL